MDTALDDLRETIALAPGATRSSATEIAYGELTVTVAPDAIPDFVALPAGPTRAAASPR